MVIPQYSGHSYLLASILKAFWYICTSPFFAKFGCLMGLFYDIVEFPFYSSFNVVVYLKYDISWQVVANGEYVHC